MSNQRIPRELCLREKLLTYGAKNLSDIELLAVIISSGNAKKSCLQLAQDLMLHFGNLRAILNSDSSTFQEVPGLGIVRYTQLQAAQEICHRCDFIDLQHLTKLTHTEQTYHYLKRQLRDKKNETFAILFLDNQHRVLAYEELFHGTINQATIHIRPIIERILKVNAAAVIFAHNHPSGVSDASHADIAITNRIRGALEHIDVRLLDHLIIGDNEVYSIHEKIKWDCKMRKVIGI